MAASSPTITITFQSDLPGGCRIISGTMTCTNTYVTGGINNALNISSYFLSTSTPTTVITGDDGYVAQTTRSTATSTLIKLFEAGADAAALDEFANAGDASGVICTFISMGQTP